MYKDLIEEGKKMFPKLPLTCPFKPGPFYVRDFIDTEKAEYKQNDTKRFGFQLPNGRYRVMIKWYTKTDPMVYMIQYQMDIRTRLGEEEF